MTSPIVLEFRILHLRPDTTVGEAGAAAHETWPKAVTDLKKADGCNRVFLGRKVEDPSGRVICLGESPFLPTASARQLASGTQVKSKNKSDWSSLAASKNHAATSKPFADDLNGRVVHDQKTYHAALLGPAAEVDAVFAAPTTEVFTAFGAEPGCLDNVREFVAKVEADRPEGCLGVVAGPVEEEIAKEGAVAGAKGPAVVMMLGWEGVEEHMRAKGMEGGGEWSFLALLAAPRFASHTDLLGSTHGQHPPVAGAAEGGRDVSREFPGAVRDTCVTMEWPNRSSHEQAAFLCDGKHTLRVGAVALHWKLFVNNPRSVEWAIDLRCVRGW